MKFGQFKEYYTRDIFLEKSYTKCGGKLFPEFFPKNQNWANHWINSPNLYAVCICCMPSWGLSKYILKLSCRPLAFNSQSFFKKQRECYGKRVMAKIIHSQTFLKKRLIWKCRIIIRKKSVIIFFYFESFKNEPAAF